MANIPIRLVHQNGNITELMATDVALDVERKTGGSAVPLTGSTRVGFDMNLNSATIIVNGIITDDTHVATESSVSAASAIVDFSLSHESATTSCGLGEPWNTGNAEQTGGLLGATTTTVENAITAITLVASGGLDMYNIWFVNHNTALDNIYGIDSGSPDSTKKYYIGVYRTDTQVYATAAQAADNFCDLINTDGTLSTKFFAELQTSSITGEANTQVKITQLTAGDLGNTNSPVYNQGIFLSRRAVPYLRVFTGGQGSNADNTATKALSAGDKVMNLYGVLNNSNNQRLFSQNKSRRFGDYIIAIQIPYNSKYWAGGATGLEYSARNFFMPTGSSTSTQEKLTENSLPASDPFDIDNRWNTGIKGSVQKATFTQLGGEPIYSFTIIFAPIDKIW